MDARGCDPRGLQNRGWEPMFAVRRWIIGGARQAKRRVEMDQTDPYTPVRHGRRGLS